MRAPPPPFQSIGDLAQGVVDRLNPANREKETTMSTKALRGFAVMDPEKRREIARKGGASVPPYKRSFARDRDLAASAGRAGGEAGRGPRQKAV